MIDLAYIQMFATTSRDEMPKKSVTLGYKTGSPPDLKSRMGNLTTLGYMLPTIGLCHSSSCTSAIHIRFGWTESIILVNLIVITWNTYTNSRREAFKNYLADFFR